jgi:IMP dehydrogenase
MKKTLTFDDVNIVPKYSEVMSRENVDLTTKFTKLKELQIPIVSSPMDTVTGWKMAKEMMDLGGVGVIHRFNTIEEQSKMMKSLHRKWDSFFNTSDGKERSADNDYDEWYRKVKLWNKPPSKSDFEDLKDYWLFADDIAEMDRQWRNKPLCAAVGVTGDYLERVKDLILNGCNVIFIDVAHGHHKLVGDAINTIKGENNVEVVAGSVATKQGVSYLCEGGADAIRIGIGNGSLCETRIRTGVGVPQVSALIDSVTTADNYGVPIIADGGIRTIGDVCKGLGCGADTVMLGSLLSGTKETPGEIEKVGEWPNEQLFKKYRGSASRDSKRSDKNVEGNHKIIPYKGKLHRIISDIRDGIRSSFSYTGANNMSEYHSKVELIEVTNAGQVEASPHLLRS